MSRVWSYTDVIAHLCPDRQAIGVLAALELFTSRVDERENEFLLKLLEKHQVRLKAQFDRHVVSIGDIHLAPMRAR